TTASTSRQPATTRSGMPARSTSSDRELPDAQAGTDELRWARIGALIDPVRRRVFEFVERAGPCTGGTVATELGLGRTLVAHHLERLERVGLVVTESAAPTGRAGRPSVVYALGTRPELPGRRYELLAELLAAADQPPTAPVIAL